MEPFVILTETKPFPAYATLFMTAFLTEAKAQNRTHRTEDGCRKSCALGVTGLWQLPCG